MVEATGLEPAASWSQTKHSTKLSYAPIYIKSNLRESINSIKFDSLFIIQHHSLPCQPFDGKFPTIFGNFAIYSGPHDGLVFSQHFQLKSIVNCGDLCYNSIRSKEVYIHETIRYRPGRRFHYHKNGRARQQRYRNLFELRKTLFGHKSDAGVGPKTPAETV